MARPAAEPARQDSPACVVVDDDPGTLTRLTRDLEHRYSRDYVLFAVLSAQRGLGILERLQATGRPVALVIAALKMPGMTGVELLSHARSLHPLAKRALLVDYLDFHSNPPLQRALTLGQADYWLTKPWDPPDRLLYPRVAELLGEWREDTEPWRFAIVHLVGDRWSRRSHELRELLDRHGLPYDFHPADTDEGRELLRQVNRGPDRLPVVLLRDGRAVVQPSNAALVKALGGRTSPGPGRHDVVVVGGGLAGLSAAVYAASEGLRTVLIEREAYGGQAA